MVGSKALNSASRGPLRAHSVDQKPSEVFAVVDEDDKMMGQLNECKENNNKTPIELVCVPEPE